MIKSTEKSWAEVLHFRTAPPHCFQLLSYHLVRFCFFLRLIASYHLLTDCACLAGRVSVQIEPAERKQSKRREKTKGDAGGREAQAFSSPMMTLTEQRQKQGLILIITMWEIGIRKMGIWVRIFLVTDCILLQLDIMARKFQLAFISTAGQQIMILA